MEKGGAELPDKLHTAWDPRLAQNLKVGSPHSVTELPAIWVSKEKNEFFTDGEYLTTHLGTGAKVPASPAQVAGY